MKSPNTNESENGAAAGHPFRSAVLRGLGVLAPPLLTILIFLWIISTTKTLFLEPVTNGVREAILWRIADVRTDLDSSQQTVAADGQTYVRLDSKTFIPQTVYERVQANPGQEPPPHTAEAIYRRYVDLTYLRPYYAIPFFLALFVLLLYMLGKLITAGIGRVFGNMFEQGIRRLPLVRNVYSGVKQVSNFLFGRREIQVTRIVAVEYPRQGVWSLGFVTGESLAELRGIAAEPMLAVLIPCSPIPMSGFTIMVAKSECVDLNMTTEQAFQFIISCGVVVPPQQELAAAADGDTPALPQPADTKGDGARSRQSRPD
jgi:uncharacterized membrane protein